MKRTLLISRQAPYQSHLARGALDAALAAAVFEQDVTLLFMDDGLWQLLDGQQPDAAYTKSLEKTLRSLNLYDLEKLYFEQAAAVARGLSSEDFCVPCEPVTDTASFIDSFDVIWSF
ncbi:sulfurtransferase complex subunit TusC [Halieaceae bacterium IMCC14734]|uniref:Sulfurtransferase complex subunit TusC n=1 Tax=Candidatus Litorirhabdus singularis TaxID=2518993 RepID=A0ABT3TGF0_9GAMM|nr:sulfurtransferase complex subunit TusC [Candidatus Litorirhabdus singularis]MCX2981388.1 sulfurtransferase complex subunit TusC [Candidatus Litorirhabdus singularis]